VRPSFAAFAVTVQVLFILGHAFFLFTWMQFWSPGHRLVWIIAVSILAFSFIVASVLAHRYRGSWVRWVYTAASTWLGLATYFFLAACGCWLVWLARQRLPDRGVALALYGVAVVVAIYGVINASLVRVRRVEVRLAGLPAGWSGSTLGLVSDLHLGPIRGARLSRTVVQRLNQAAPRLVLIAGDLFDGTPCDAAALLAPWRNLAAPGYYVAGNHEGYGNEGDYVAAARSAGLRVTGSEAVELTGVQLLGLPYGGRGAIPRFDAGRPSIALAHAPEHLEAVADAGVSLLVAGHTHGGQFFPVTLIVRRIYRQFAHGLHRVGGLQVLVSYGVGTWGPPLRVGTHPEMMLITLRAAD
jgi:hypothetical protein